MRDKMTNAEYRELYRLCWRYIWTRSKNKDTPSTLAAQRLAKEASKGVARTQQLT